MHSRSLSLMLTYLSLFPKPNLFVCLHSRSMSRSHSLSVYAISVCLPHSLHFCQSLLFRLSLSLLISLFRSLSLSLLFLPICRFSSICLSFSTFSVCLFHSLTLSMIFPFVFATLYLSIRLWCSFSWYFCFVLSFSLSNFCIPINYLSF